MGAIDEISVTIENVGTSFVTASVTGPAKYQIHRARATIVSGAAATVALRVRQKDVSHETKLEYSLTATEIDSIETQDKILIHTKARDSRANGQGTTIIGVQCDAGTNTIYVALDIEVLA